MGGHRHTVVKEVATFKEEHFLSLVCLLGFDGAWVSAGFRVCSRVELGFVGVESVFHNVVISIAL